MFYFIYRASIVSWLVNQSIYYSHLFTCSVDVSLVVRDVAAIVPSGVLAVCLSVLIVLVVGLFSTWLGVVGKDPNVVPSLLVVVANTVVLVIVVSVFSVFVVIGVVVIGCNFVVVVIGELVVVVVVVAVVLRSAVVGQRLHVFLHNCLTFELDQHVEIHEGHAACSSTQSNKENNKTKLKKLLLLTLNHSLLHSLTH